MAVIKIADIFPPPNIVATLEPEDLAFPLIEYLFRLEVSTRQQPFNRNQLVAGSEFKEYCGRKQYESIAKAVTEAWVWLEREGLVAPHPGYMGNESQYVTRRGKEFRESGDIKKFQAANLLPFDVLDPMLAAKARPPFLRGDYDSAIFEAFKQVEITVRGLSGSTQDDYGVNLMRKAFKPGEGPLVDHRQVTSEQEGISALFAGTIGSFKNPASHRDVDLTDPVEAMELISLADLLIRITKRRGADSQVSTGPG